MMLTRGRCERGRVRHNVKQDRLAKWNRTELILRMPN